MALPSAVTLASATIVVFAGVGLVSAASNGSEDPARDQTSTTTSHATQPQQPQQQPRRRTRQGRRHHPAPDVVPRVLLEVYNNSGITGLASHKAALLQGAGWNVAATDNWYGVIPRTTVYYPDGLKRDATMLARLLHVSRLRHAVAPMQFDRLTVIFTSS